jgi:hypothetical protein
LPRRNRDREIEIDLDANVKGVREGSSQGGFQAGLGVRGNRGKERGFCIWFELY